MKIEFQTIIDREAYKTSDPQLPDCRMRQMLPTWYAANRMEAVMWMSGLFMKMFPIFGNEDGVKRRSLRPSKAAHDP